MPEQHPFTIYNASAGSGKTFTLVKEYLKILFKSNNRQQFKHILAITFTNKAVGEMKQRIVDTLKSFSSEDILNKPDSMFLSICEDLQIEPETLHNKSKSILNSIIYNYAAFDISTIDGFTHRIIRTFAHDLKLPLNFEVELDQDSLLSEAVDSLIAKAGSDKALTKILVDFAIEKADDDKSWDITFDFNKIAKLLVNENDTVYINTLKDKSFQDFKLLKTQIKEELHTAQEQVIAIAKALLSLINESGLQFNDFSGSYLPKHFQKLASKNFSVGFESKWQEDLESKTLYPKRVTPEIASTIEQIQPQIATAFNNTKQLVLRLQFLKAFYRNITPLSVLNLINRELIGIKTEQNKMLISEFNSIISNEIKNQPTPFIYERLGEKFRHYFIDEFQDTSQLQWENLIPLIDNTLSSENLKQEQGTAMIVGDAKQAIYRWRGGKAEQFIDLFNKKSNPFFTEQYVETLPINYRSFKEIIAFNNSFFKHLSETVFSNDNYSNLYQSSNQNQFVEQEGYVNISLLDIEKGDNRDELYPEKVHETIDNCLEKGFKLKDICILVRKKKEGIAIAEFLSEQNIAIMSSETMLIYNSQEVRFIDNFLKLLLHQDNNQIKIDVLNYLVLKNNIEDKHNYFATHLKLSTLHLFKSFEAYNVFINPANLLQLPLYELAETLVRSFNLVETSNAYIQFYLDFVLDYSQKKGSDLPGFLEHFDKKKENLSIVSPQGQDAIQIMTIHKSKGLEFPVVIFPYADLDIYKEMEPKEWFPLDKEKYNGFSYTLLNYSKDFENYGEAGQTIYTQHQAEVELDNINLLYVALTRPVEQLYIISKKDITSKGILNPKTYAGLLIQYLISKQYYNESELNYTFGNPNKTSKSDHKETSTIEHQEFISTAKESHSIKIVTNSGYLWDTAQQDAIERGNLIHNIMSKISTRDDIDFVINDFIESNLISKTQAQELQKTISLIVDHPELKMYFTNENTVYNERDIISKSGAILRPDRLVINTNNQATILDYKTGNPDNKHAQQLQNYQDILEEMQIKVVDKILIYVNDTIQIIKV